MKIRELGSNEKLAWINLVKEGDRRGRIWAEQKFDSYILSKKKKRLLVVVENMKLIGFAGIKGEDLEENVSKELNEKYLLINWIAFVPEFRNKGLGSKLLSECEKYALEWDKKGIWLGCKNGVIPFYKKNGYKMSGNFINDKGKEENLMIKEIH